MPFIGSLPLLLAAFCLYMLALVLLGYTISTVARTQMQAMQLTFFFFLPSMLLSGFMFPFRGMPGWAQGLGENSPLTHLLRTIRAVMLKGADYPGHRPRALHLALFVAAYACPRAHPLPADAGLKTPQARVGARGKWCTARAAIVAFAHQTTSSSVACDEGRRSASILRSPHSAHWMHFHEVGAADMYGVAHGHHLSSTEIVRRSPSRGPTQRAIADCAPRLWPIPYRPDQAHFSEHGLNGCIGNDENVAVKFGQFFCHLTATGFWLGVQVFEAISLKKGKSVAHVERSTLMSVAVLGLLEHPLRGLIGKAGGRVEPMMRAILGF